LNAARAFQAVRIKLDWSWDERSIKARRVNPKNIFTMLLSWLYEFTPEGIIRTEDSRFQKLCEGKPH
jgi:hypothetical protein